MYASTSGNNKGLSRLTSKQALAKLCFLFMKGDSFLFPLLTGSLTYPILFFPIPYYV